MKGNPSVFVEGLDWKKVSSSDINEGARKDILELRIYKIDLYIFLIVV